MSAIELDGASGRGRKKSGRRSLAVPALDRKLDHLLARTGRPAKWLTEVLVSPDGRSPTAPAISNWKKTGRVPVDYLASLRFAFGLDETCLLLADFEEFRAAVDAAAQPGSGRHWRALLDRCEERDDGLVVEVEDALFRRAVGNLAFQRPGRVKRPRLPTLYLDDRIRFAIPAAALAGLTKPSEDPPTIVLCCEDKLGWKIIAPHRHDRGFEPDDDRWVLPGPRREALYLERTLGLYRAVAIAIGGTLPVPIAAAFLANRTVWATDALAAWLAAARPPALVLSRQFLVLAPRR